MVTHAEAKSSAPGQSRSGLSRDQVESTAQAYVAASVFDRVRLQVGLAAIFPVRTHEETSWSLLPTGGLQFLWP